MASSTLPSLSESTRYRRSWWTLGVVEPTGAERETAGYRWIHGAACGINAMCTRTQRECSEQQCPRPRDLNDPASPYYVRLMRALVFVLIGVGFVTGERLFFWIAVALAVPTMIAWGRAVAQRLS